MIKNGEAKIGKTTCECGRTATRAALTEGGGRVMVCEECARKYDDPKNASIEPE